MHHLYYCVFVCWIGGLGGFWGCAIVVSSVLCGLTCWIFKYNIGLTVYGGLYY